MLLWRAASNILPTYDNLQQKMVNVPGMCPVCQRSNESIFHVFVQCSFALECWQILGIPLPRDEHNDFILWLENFFQNCSREVANMGVMIIWNLWYSRNQVVWNNKQISASKLVQNSSVLLQQWEQAREDVTLSYGSARSIQATTWSKPPVGWLKCNVDASVSAQNNCIGSGMVLRDSEAKFIAAKCVKHHKTHVDAFVAEMISLREALSWLKEQGCHNVLVESDSMLVVSYLHSSDVIILHGVS